MVGLLASGAGAFVALPGSAMPVTTEAAPVEETEAAETLPEPTAAETLPAPETDVVTEADSLLEEAPVADDTMVEDAPVADDAAMEEEPIAEDAAVEEETIVEETTVEEEETVAESDLEPTDADTTEAADIETLSDDAIEASDTMDGEPVVEEPSVEEETVVEETTVEEEETIADDATIEEEPVAEEPIVEEEPVAESEEFDTTALTIAELTGSSESFEILAAALAAADLTEVLAGEGPYTVFAPTDEAFEALPEELVAQLLEPENKDSLVQLLTYHVVDGAVLSTDLEEGAVETLAGDDLTVSLEEGVTVNSSNVVFADVEASNGVIHVIDRVIMPGEPEAEVSVEDTIAPEESIAIDETEVEETVELESTVEEMPAAE